MHWGFSGIGAKQLSSLNTCFPVRLLGDRSVSGFGINLNGLQAVADPPKSFDAADDAESDGRADGPWCRIDNGRAGVSENDQISYR